MNQSSFVLQEKLNYFKLNRISMHDSDNKLIRNKTPNAFSSKSSYTIDMRGAHHIDTHANTVAQSH
jgi:hypothetical protein